MSTALQLSGYSGQQIALIRKTIAKDTNDSEFNLFMEAAARYQLDPFRKQIMAIVFNKDKEDKRQMVIIVGRDGHRVIAQRCGDYRPASEPPEVTIDDTLMGDTNPKGIVKASVRLWKQDNRGEWYPVVGEAYWDEFAPLKEIWEEDPQTRKRRPTGRKILDSSGKWAQMPVLMLAKCAEVQALRMGWPDHFGGLHGEEEVEGMRAAETASEMIEREEERLRAEKIGGRGHVIMTFDLQSGILDRVPVGQVYDRCAEFISGADGETVLRWSEMNRVAFRDFWSLSPTDALEVKKLVEEKTASFIAAARSLA